MVFCKTFIEALSVLPDALNEVRGDANVESAIPLACENVDCGLFHLQTRNWVNLLSCKGEATPSGAWCA